MVDMTARPNSTSDAVLRAEVRKAETIFAAGRGLHGSDAHLAPELLRFYCRGYIRPRRARANMVKARLKRKSLPAGGRDGGVRLGGYLGGVCLAGVFQIAANSAAASCSENFAERTIDLVVARVAATAPPSRSGLAAAGSMRMLSMAVAPVQASTVSASSTSTKSAAPASSTICMRRLGLAAALSMRTTVLAAAPPVSS